MPRAVQSALSADTILIINDHSTDDTAQVAGDLQRVYPQVSVLDSPSPGVVPARNVAIQHAQDGLIIPLDADDYFVDGGLSHLAHAWTPGHWVYSDYYLAGGGQTERRYAPPPGVLHRKNITHATICVHKDDLLRVGGYDPAFEICCEDWALTIALTEAGISPIHFQDATYVRRLEAGGRSRACLRYAKTIRQLLATKYGRLYA